MAKHIKIQVNTTINKTLRTKAEKLLCQNGVDKDEVENVLQALGYVLLDTELYPDLEGEDSGHDSKPYIGGEPIKFIDPEILKQLGVKMD